MTYQSQRDNVIGQLTRLLDSETTLTSSALKQNNLSLLREKLAEHKRELIRLRSSLSHARDRANLLSNVRHDIDEYRANNPEAAEAEQDVGDGQRHRGRNPTGPEQPAAPRSRPMR